MNFIEINLNQICNTKLTCIVIDMIILIIVVIVIVAQWW